MKNPINAEKKIDALFAEIEYDLRKYKSKINELSINKGVPDAIKNPQGSGH